MTLESEDDAVLLRWRDAGKDIDLLYHLGQCEIIDVIQETDLRDA
jgi:hypothetical protein